MSKNAYKMNIMNKATEQPKGKRKTPWKLIRVYGVDTLDAYLALKAANYNMTGLIGSMIKQAATEKAAWKPREGTNDSK